VVAGVAPIDGPLTGIGAGVGELGEVVAGVCCGCCVEVSTCGVELGELVETGENTRSPSHVLNSTMNATDENTIPITLANLGARCIVRSR
jgi:hypothetical protein